MNSTIFKIRLEAVGQELDNELKRSNIDVNEAQRESIQQGILQAWQKVAVDWKNADSNAKQAIESKVANEIKAGNPSIQNVAGRILNNGVNGAFNVLEAIGVPMYEAEKYGTNKNQKR